jgi:5-carboxymethyl-2-hydroxymuconate isomerase
LRITPGRDKALIANAGAALLATVEEHFGALMRTRPIGITLHIDETVHAYEGKYSNLASHLAAEG